MNFVLWRHELLVDRLRLSSPEKEGAIATLAVGEEDLLPFGEGKLSV